MKKKYILSLVILLAVLGHFLKLAYDAGIFVTITPTNNRCLKIEGIHGPEDIAEVDQHLFITSTYLPFRYNFEVGNIYYLNSHEAKPNPKPLLTADFQLSPHGLHAHRMKNGVIRLWVINHYQAKDSIEIFDFIKGSLQFVKSIKSEVIFNSNDIVAINDEEFYLTHDHGSLNKKLKLLENFSRFGFGFLTFYNGKEFREVESHFSFPNGIVTKNGFLYLAQMLSKKITKYKILDGGDIEKIEDISLPYPPDNLSLSGNTITIATHPKALDLKKHAESPGEISPSIIFDYDLTKKELVRLFEDDGKLVSAASVGVKKLDALYIGNIYSDFILKCEL